MAAFYKASMDRAHYEFYCSDWSPSSMLGVKFCYTSGEVSVHILAAIYKASMNRAHYESYCTDWSPASMLGVKVC